MNIAIVGCGYVADFYMATLSNHSSLRLVGAYDQNPDRLAAFSLYYKARAFSSLEALLADPDVSLVLNLTNPSSHYTVSRQSLEAGKHVYSEKPLAMMVDDARRLVELAEERGLSLSGAPASVLGETACALRTAVVNGRVGEVRLAYAELEDGPVFEEPLASWKSPSGAPWPAKDEFSVGCTLEHAGYYLTWLCLFFGPVKRMSAFASRRVEDKGTGQALDTIANDFSSACLEFASGAVARLTCGLVAPQDRSLHIYGDAGILSVSDAWDSTAPIYFRSTSGLAPGVFGRIQRALQKRLPLRSHYGVKIRPKPFKGRLPPYPSKMDFARGPAAQAEALLSGQTPLLSARFVLHITEVVLALQTADHGGVFNFESWF